MKSKNIITIGFRVGKLTVTKKTEERKNGYIVWNCKCDCGGTVKLDTRCLQRQTVKDCGCSSVVRPGMLDLTGMRFGKLVCKRPHDEKDAQGNTQWVCRCDCGKECITALHQLRAGYKKSCGCLSHPPIKDYIGMRFSLLTVTGYAGKKNGMHRWKCLCDCGNEVIVGQTPLQNGRTKSCGCLKKMKKLSGNMKNGYKGFLNGTNIGMLEARISKPPIASNTSGYNGVYRNSAGLWSAQITFKNKTYYLGSFTDINDAVLARRQGEEMFESFLDWYYEKYRKENNEIRQL